MRIAAKSRIFAVTVCSCTQLYGKNQWRRSIENIGDLGARKHAPDQRRVREGVAVSNREGLGVAPTEYFGQNPAIGFVLGKMFSCDGLLGESEI